MARVGSGAVGVVCDGCGEGQASELGAALSCAVGLEAMRVSVERGEALGGLPQLLSEAVVEALGHVAERATSARLHAAFVRDHLLATVVAFAVTDDAAIVIAFGDGVVLVDDRSTTLDEDNRPSYLGYSLLGRSVVPRVLRFGAVERLAIATDGLSTRELCKVAEIDRPDLTRALRRLQREGAVEDDAAVASARRRAISEEARGAEAAS